MQKLLKDKKQYHCVQIMTLYIKIILASWIHKPSLDLIKNKTKKLLKKFLSDQIFQKLTLKFFLLHKTENIVLFHWIKHPSWSCLKLPFIGSAVYAKIIALSYIKICPVLSCKNGQKLPKMLVSLRIWTRGLPDNKKVKTSCLKVYHWAMKALLKIEAKIVQFHL